MSKKKKTKFSLLPQKVVEKKALEGFDYLYIFHVTVGWSPDPTGTTP